MARNYENNNSKFSKFPGLIDWDLEMPEISAKTISQRVSHDFQHIPSRLSHCKRQKSSVSSLGLILGTWGHKF